MDLKLKGKTALITGGTQGIGKAIACALAAEGVSLILVSRSASKFKALAKSADLRGTAKAPPRLIECDLTDDSGPSQVLGELKKNKLSPEIVVHCLGGSLAIRDPLSPVADWRKVFRFNLETAIELNNGLIPVLRKKKWGRIVHISSVSARENLGPVIYCSAKAALTAYARSLGRVMADTGVVISAIHPGAVFAAGGPWDRALKENPSQVAKYLKEQVARHSFTSPDEIASLATFLCSDLASACIGTAVDIDGGSGRSF